MMEQDLGAPGKPDRAGGAIAPEPLAASQPKALIPSAGWLPWSSKGKRYDELPVDRGTLVDVRYRDGGDRFCVPAGIDTGPHYRDAETRFWVQERHHSDIMFWRLAVPAVAENDAPQ